MEKKVVIITGASSGIGRAVALLAARKGYYVVLNARRKDRLEELATKIKANGGEALVIEGDMARLEEQKHLVDKAIAQLGHIHILVNNAGFPLPMPFSQTPPEELRRQWDVNVAALSTLTRIALPHLRESKGVVVNIGSSISRFAVPGMGNYSPSKIAVAGLTDALRRELTGQGIDVCLVEPGPVATEFTERAGGDTGSYSPLSISAAEAAVPIVRLFEHPQKRIVVPGWLGPVLLVAGALMRVASPLVDAAFYFIVRRRVRRRGGPSSR